MHYYRKIIYSGIGRHDTREWTAEYKNRVRNKLELVVCYILASLFAGHPLFFKLSYKMSLSGMTAYLLQ